MVPEKDGTNANCVENVDRNCLRNGFGVEIHMKKHGNEVYKGNFKNDSYHGFGYYKYDSIFTPKWTYEGAFFGNVKEGYGLLSLANNNHFEGLYERDRPFGPGVLTREDGKQDVGFWQSSSIIRLITTARCSVDELGTTSANKAFLTAFRKLVEVAPPTSAAIRISGEVNLIEDSVPKLYSIYCKDPKSFMINYEEFDRVYFNDLKKIGDLVPTLSSDDFSRSSSFEDIPEVGEATQRSVTTSTMELEQNCQEQSWERLRKRINLLVAWNNSPVMVDMMTHCFNNRIYEKMVKFNVTDLLCNNRQKFEEAGPLEKACLELLECSHKGDIREFTKILFENELIINVQDNKGNGCVIISESQDNHALLYLLFLFGADLNAINDEGFTALSHALTRYLAVKNSVTDWGQSFLPEIKLRKMNKTPRVWKKCSDTSFGTTNVKSEIGRKRMSSRGRSIEVNENPYIFDISPANKRVDRPVKGKLSVSATSRHPRSTQETFMMEKEAQEKQNRLREICQTMELLLKLGVNPNLSKVPQPAIILALFTGDLDLIKMLLEAGANPNARTLPEEGWLTPLHVLCLAKPQPAFPEIMDLLLQFGADPNAEAAVSFAPATQDFVLNGFYESEFTVSGMTPVQALLLREDASYVPGKEILKNLLLRLHDITSKEHKYFGHSFLSLAMIRLNMTFLFTLLHIFNADANEELDQHWGNIITTYLTFLASEKQTEAIITLIELEQAGMNPLRTVKIINNLDHGNAINFALRMFQGTQSYYKSYRRHWSEQNSGSSTRETLKSFHRGRSRPASKSSSTRPKEKEILKKLTLLQDLGRDKVDSYVRGRVLRRFIKYLRGISSKTVDKRSSTLIQAMNWFRTEDDFIKVLRNNVLSGLTFVSEEETNAIFDIFSWCEKKEPTKQLSTQKKKEKISLRQFKEVISKQLADGVTLDQLNTQRRISPTVSSSRSRKPTNSRYVRSSLKKLPGIEVLDDSKGGNQIFEEDHFDKAMQKVAFVEKVESLLTISAPQVRWAKRYGTKFLKIPKIGEFNKDLFPDVDVDPFLYRVCYKCVKRDPDLQLCPMCKLIYYCSKKCNFRDVLNYISNHRCKVDFYGRGFKWRQYCLDENGELKRIPRDGQEDWETQDILDDKATEKYGRRNKFVDGTKKHHAGSITRRGRGGASKGDGGGSKWDDGASKGDDGGSKWNTGGGKGSPGGGLNGEPGAGRGRDLTGGYGGRHENSHGRGKRILEKTGNGGKLKNARKEKKMLRPNEIRRLRQIRNKMPKGVLRDFVKWGYATKQSLQEKPWYRKMQSDQTDLDRRVPVSEAYLRMVNQIKLLEALAALHGPDFNLQSVFPWVVLRDGELYYKFNPTLFVLENYSFN